MSKLLEAAKSVIESLYDLNYENVINLSDLEQAVEQDEKQDGAGFKDWWKEHSIEWGWTLTEIDAERFWTAAQQAERQRIVGILHEVCKYQENYSLIIEKIYER